MGKHILLHQKTTEVTAEDILMLRQIKKSIIEGHDIEIRKASDGTLKVLQVKKKILPLVD